MKRRPLPSQERLRALFSYRDGELYALIDRGKTLAGARVGTLCRNGYVRLGLDYVEYQAHRVIWKMHYGTEPDIIDHINGIRHDNRIENLQELSNRENVSKGYAATALPTGVKKMRSGKYGARILFGEKRIWLGTFGTIEEAAAAYHDALLQHKGTCG